MLCEGSSNNDREFLIEGAAKDSLSNNRGFLRNIFESPLSAIIVNSERIFCEGPSEQ